MLPETKPLNVTVSRLALGSSTIFFSVASVRLVSPEMSIAWDWLTAVVLALLSVLGLVFILVGSFVSLPMTWTNQAGL